jgi:hypothetical protein
MDFFLTKLLLLPAFAYSNHLLEYNSLLLTHLFVLAQLRPIALGWVGPCQFILYWCTSSARIHQSIKVGPVILKSLQIIDTLDMSAQIFKYFQILEKKKCFLNSTNFRFSEFSKFLWISKILFFKKISNSHNSRKMLNNSVNRNKYFSEFLKYAK